MNEWIIGILMIESNFVAILRLCVTTIYSEEHNMYSISTLATPGYFWKRESSSRISCSRRHAMHISRKPDEWTNVE